MFSFAGLPRPPKSGFRASTAGSVHDFTSPVKIWQASFGDSLRFFMRRPAASFKLNMKAIPPALTGT